MNLSKWNSISLYETFTQIAIIKWLQMPPAASREGFDPDRGKRHDRHYATRSLFMSRLQGKGSARRFRGIHQPGRG